MSETGQPLKKWPTQRWSCSSSQTTRDRKLWRDVPDKKFAVPLGFEEQTFQTPPIRITDAHTSGWSPDPKVKLCAPLSCLNYTFTSFVDQGGIGVQVRCQQHMWKAHLATQKGRHWETTRRLQRCKSRRDGRVMQQTSGGGISCQSRLSRNSRRCLQFPILFCKRMFHSWGVADKSEAFLFLSCSHKSAVAQIVRAYKENETVRSPLQIDRLDNRQIETERGEHKEGVNKQDKQENDTRQERKKQIGNTNKRATRSEA